MVGSPSLSHPPQMPSSATTRPLARGVDIQVSCGHPIADFRHPTYVLCIMQWDDSERIGHPIHPKYVYCWTPNSGILAKALATTLAHG